MIAKGNLHASGARLAAYMVTGKDGEKAELYQLRGFADAGIRDAFKTIDAAAKGSHCTKPFFHVQVRNPQGDRALTTKEWEHVADRIERINGLTGQPRAIAFHTDAKTGERHMHVAWSRIDEENLKARPLPFFKLRLKEVCRELEIELGLTQVRNDRARPEIRAAQRGEQAQSKRLGNDDRAIRGAIRDAWERADNGKAFVAALAESGLVLCAGDRRDYVVMDERGGTHALGKRLLGVSAADTRKVLADLERDAMPSVLEGRATMHTRAMVREAEVPAIVTEAKAAAIEITHPLLQPMVPTTRETAQVMHTAVTKTVPLAAKGLEQAADVVSGLVTGLGEFLFGGIGHSPAAPQEPAAAPVMGRQRVRSGRTAAQERERYLTNMASPAEMFHEGHVMATVKAQTMPVRPEIVDAMRRKREQAKRERDEYEDDRER
ncbi:MAG: hypothetical protein IT555_00380 [Acetobacteraceae bacterium]|nr:hypothetical protein [Acetobacteraceae bacterium]